MHLNKVHHIAIIASDYQRSRDFYTKVLGFRVEHEYYREERRSFKTDLSLNGEYLIELFSFPNPPARLSYPEACGLRHLAFEVNDVESARSELTEKGIKTESVRQDPYTGKKFLFFEDPDGLPVELYEK